MWILSSIGANLCIAFLEYTYRTNEIGPALLVKIAPWIILSQFCLWYTWRAGPGLMLAWVVFFLGNTVLRILNAHYMLGEPINGASWTALALIVAGAFVMHYGKA